jgi:MoxR-like ATPase
MDEIKTWTEKIKASVERVILGKGEVIEKLLVALLCRGHVLLEDVPGVGKTILARAMSLSLGGEFRRVQCTADLLPADVLGVSIYNQKSGQFDFRQGPIMTNVLLVDEINRATPRTQSALLEAMEERTISVEGRSLPLPDPFFILATENPVEFEGTFPLPEAQKDRFFLCLSMGYPPEAAEMEIMVAQRRLSHPVTDLTTVTDTKTVLAMQTSILEVAVSAEIEDFILSLVESTRTDPRLSLGASPRASMALYKGAQALAAVRGRTEATIEDVRELAVPVLLKRIQVRSEQLLKGTTEQSVIAQLLQQAQSRREAAGARA